MRRRCHLVSAALLAARESSPIPPPALLVWASVTRNVGRCPSPAHVFSVKTDGIMRLVALIKPIRPRSALRGIARSLQVRCFQHDFVPRDPMAKPRKFKYPAFYDPYGPRPPPSDKVVELADRIAALSPEERRQMGPALRERFLLPKLQEISTEGMDVGAPHGGPAAKVVEEKEEKTAFDVKLEKFDAAAKIKVIKEVRVFTSLGLKEAKELVEKAPVLLKQGVTKEEANEMLEKINAAGGVAVME